MLNFIKNYIQRFSILKRDVDAYIELTYRGNVVEHKTDFSKPNLNPVLLIHGFGTTRKSMSVLEQRLRMDGFDCFSVNLGGFLGKINTNGVEDLAQKVKNKVDSLYERFKIPKFAIIGHSKGGLVGKYYVSILGGDEHVHTLITLGTPHKGDWWALLAALTVIGLVSKSLWQMMPHSRFIRKLYRASIPSTVKTISISSTDDQVVPPDNSILEIPAGTTHIKNVKLFGYTHTDYLIKRGVYEAIRRELEPF